MRDMPKDCHRRLTNRKEANLVWENKYHAVADTAMLHLQEGR